MTSSHTPSREEVIEHNLRLHATTADDYDQIHHYLHNRVEQSWLWSDLRLLHAWLQQRVQPPVRYLDLGCGTGNIALKLLSLGGHVVGLDLSRAMLDILARKVARAGFQDRFRGVVSSADEATVLAAHAELLQPINALCISSVLHHLYDYGASLRQLPQFCPSLRLVYITHEPCARASLAPPRRRQRLYNLGVRQLDVLLSDLIRLWRPARGYADDPIADYHAFGQGVDESAVTDVLAAAGFTRVLVHRRYNMRRTTLCSLIDNMWLPSLRNDIFPITMFTLALSREGAAASQAS